MIGLSRRISFQKVLKWLLRAVLTFLVVSHGWVLVYRWMDPPATPLMLIRAFQRPAGFQATRYQFVSEPDIAAAFFKAVLASEDQRFFEHGGFDWEAIRKALHHNDRNPKKIRGASTISQQTAKNLFLWPQRGWVRKGLEAYFTSVLELYLPKDRILELYANIVELGPGIYGVEAASQKFFFKSARDLTRVEAAQLASVLPNPLRYRVDRPGPYLQGRQRAILVAMGGGPRRIPPEDTPEIYGDEAAGPTSGVSSVAEPSQEVPQTDFLNEASEEPDTRD